MQKPISARLWNSASRCCEKQSRKRARGIRLRSYGIRQGFRHFKGVSRILYESGIAEENAVTTAAAMAKAGMVTFAAGFSAFMIDEVYSQLRMGDINHAPLKIAATHCGLDVGEDGKTHQCLDYLSLLSNLRHMQVLTPADPNQTDAMVRYMVQSGEAQCLCMGRSKTAVLTNEDGTPFFGKDYQFRYGEGHWLRRGKDAAIITFGMMAPKALEAWGKNCGGEELRFPFI